MHMSKKYGPVHLQNFASVPILGLILLVYGAQFMNHPQMNQSKSSKIYPKTKVRNFDLNRFPVHSSLNCT